MTTSHHDLETVRRLAGRMAALRPTTPEEIALLAFMAGTLYGLGRAVELRFDDARMTPDIPKAPSELRDTFAANAGGSAPPDAWLSGFYFDSAIMRISALRERVNKYLGTKPDVAQKVHNVVNKLKHDVDADIAVGWSIRFADVLKAAEDLCGLLEKAITATY